MTIFIKRIYDERSANDGYRVLVDRLWPRGVSKERARLDAWLKDVAPSPELRTWFGHNETRFTSFKDQYQAELADNPAVKELGKLISEHTAITLLYAAKDPKINHAVVLRDFMMQ